MESLNRKAAAATFLAFVGVLLLVWPDERVAFAALMAMMYQVSRTAACWMASSLPRWVRLLVAVGSTGAVVVFFVLVPPSGADSLARILARSAGAATLIVLSWRAAAWEILAERFRGTVE